MKIRGLRSHEQRLFTTFRERVGSLFQDRRKICFQLRSASLTRKYARSMQLDRRKTICNLFVIELYTFRWTPVYILHIRSKQIRSNRNKTSGPCQQNLYQYRPINFI